MCNCSSACDCNSLIATSKGEKGDPGLAVAGVSVGSASTTLDVSGLDTGTTFLLASATGKTYNLPTQPATGTYYDFVVTTDVTSNDYRIVAGGSDKLTGSLFLMKSGDYPAFQKPGAADNAIVMNGTTTGGTVGTNFRLTYSSDLRKWVVSGQAYGSGVIATPFATV